MAINAAFAADPDGDDTLAALAGAINANAAAVQSAARAQTASKALTTRPPEPPAPSLGPTWLGWPWRSPRRDLRPIRIWHGRTPRFVYNPLIGLADDLGHHPVHYPLIMLDRYSLSPPLGLAHFRMRLEASPSPANAIVLTSESMLLPAGAWPLALAWSMIFLAWSMIIKSIARMVMTTLTAVLSCRGCDPDS